jgi:signal transduction histidine kinase
VKRSAVGHEYDLELFDRGVGPRDPAFGTPLRGSDLAVVALALGASCAAVAVVVKGGVVSDTSAFAAALVANIVAFAIGGLLWRHGRPSSAFGNLLLAEGGLVFLSAFAAFSAPSLYLIGFLGGWAAALGATWLLLAFPDVRPGGAAWIVMGTAVATFLVGELPRLLTSAHEPGLPVLGRCDVACPANAARIVSAPGVAQSFRHVESALQGLWGIGLIVFLAVQLLRASNPRRRLLAPVFAAAVPFYAVFSYNALTMGLLDLRWGVGAQAIFLSTRIVFPLGFIAALLFARAYAGEALALMSSRLVGRPSVATVEQLVRRVLDDPDARLAFWQPRRERFVDLHGKPIVLEPASEGRTWHAFGRGSTQALAIAHDEALADDPELVEAVGATALLTLENRRLEQDLVDSVAALRASQRRLVAAASAERQKIERDLHDGVQQKLVALRIQLALALELDADGLGTRLAHLGDVFDDALDELRSVAHGIYPPLLAHEGLVAAVRDAAHRSVVPPTLEIEDVGRLSEDREAAIYYCCLEALQNVAKHAGEDAGATVRLWRDKRVVHFSVSDDGAGFVTGADAQGAGLTNMADRIGAVGGTLAVRSEPGEGTIVEVRVSVAAEERQGRDDVVHV